MKNYCNDNFITFVLFDTKISAFSLRSDILFDLYGFMFPFSAMPTDYVQNSSRPFIHYERYPTSHESPSAHNTSRYYLCSL